MDDRRAAEGVTVSRQSADGAKADDPALEREIEAALAVDPSPELVAKIRARVANEPAPASWWCAWQVAPACGYLQLGWGAAPAAQPRR